MEENKKDVLILAIETSCDETAAAVVKNGREVLSNTIYTQIKLHTLFGGVVPEIASRKHIEKINIVIETALKEAGVTLEDIDAIAVTYGTCRGTSCRGCRSKSNCVCDKETISWSASYRRPYQRQLY